MFFYTRAAHKAVFSGSQNGSVHSKFCSTNYSLHVLGCLNSVFVYWEHNKRCSSSQICNKKHLQTSCCQQKRLFKGSLHNFSTITKAWWIIIIIFLYNHKVFRQFEKPYNQAQHLELKKKKHIIVNNLTFLSGNKVIFFVQAYAYKINISIGKNAPSRFRLLN